MKIVSWNVNGIRACVRKETFFNYLYSEEPDLLFLQETKAHVDQLHPEITEPSGYVTAWSSAEQKGYSGVALYTKLNPIRIITDIGHSDYDSEGRVLGAEFDDKVVFGVYFPNSQRPGRLAYKLDFKKIFSKLAQYDFDGWAVLEWECCLKHPEDGAREGSEFIKNNMIRVTDKAFDDFASGDNNIEDNKEILGID